MIIIQIKCLHNAFFYCKCCFVILQKLLTKPHLKGSQLLYNFLTEETEFNTGFDINIGKTVSFLTNLCAYLLINCPECMNRKRNVAVSGHVPNSNLDLEFYVR